MAGLHVRRAPKSRDVEGHGTHVTAIAVGTGAAFGAAVSGSLKFTQSGSLNGVVAGSFLAATVHTPKYLGSSVSSRPMTKAAPVAKWRWQEHRATAVPQTAVARAVRAPTLAAVPPAPKRQLAALRASRAL